MTGITDGLTLGRSSVKATCVLAVDLDHDIDAAYWMQSLIRPTIAIRTSEARYHFCWVLTDQIAVPEATRFLVAMAYRLNGDPCFATVAQAIRLPGFINQKYGVAVTLAVPPDTPARAYSDTQLSLGLDVDLVTAHLRSKFPALDEKLRVPNSVTQDHLLLDLQSALAFISADDYAVWIKVTAALHSVGEEAYDIWDKWSQSSSKYDEKIMRPKWNSFGKGSHRSSVSASSVFFLASQAGWSNPGYRYTGKVSIDSLTERYVGRLIAQRMEADFAAIRVGSGGKESFRLLEWDSLKYADLDNSARRDRVERHLKKLIVELGESS